jgi:integrase
MAWPLLEPETLAVERWLQPRWMDASRRRVQRVALCLALALHGLRAIEVCHLLVHDLDAKTSRLRVKSAKRGRPRTLQLDSQFAVKLWGYAPSRRQPLDILLPTCTGRSMDPNTLVRSAHMLRPIAGRNVTFHSLRHAAARRCWQSTHDILAVMRLLGHKTLSQTHTYLQTFDDVPTSSFPQWQQQPNRHLKIWKTK